MLNLYRLEKQFVAEDYGKMLRGVLDNGLPLPGTLRLRLAEGPAGALGLALRRVVEMTYGPTPLSKAMMAKLLACQGESGAFEVDGRPDPLATASALGALSLVLGDHAALAEPAVERAYERALAALARMQGPDGLFHAAGDQTDHDRAWTAAFVLWLLGSDPAFHRELRTGQLHRWFGSRLVALDPAAVELYRVACLSQPATTSRTAARAA